MRFHVPALPGQPTTKANSHCAYTQKIVKFAEMMGDRGHEVIVYGGGESDCENYVDCYSATALPSWTPEDRDWRSSNAAALLQIRAREEPEDFLCLIAGRCQEPLANAIPEMLAVEFGIGYAGVFAPYRVYESSAWMHFVNGWRTGFLDSRDAYEMDGRNYDVVIPNYFDKRDFPFGKEAGDYLLYLGRMNARKGLEVVERVGQETGIEVVYAGNEGDYGKPEYGEWVGPVGPEERGKLLKGARATMVPTVYIEPFGGVAVESMLCGTPAITSDFGAFGETVKQGISGYRCRRIGEYAWAAENVGELSRRRVRNWALQYDMTKIAETYEAYFEHVAGLRGPGFLDTTRARPLAL